MSLMTCMCSMAHLYQKCHLHLQVGIRDVSVQARQKTCVRMCVCTRISTRARIIPDLLLVEGKLLVLHGLVRGGRQWQAKRPQAIL